VETLAKHEAPSWIALTRGELSAKVTGAPADKELQQPFDVKLIVEFYSRQ
jgi:ribosomal protein S4